MMNYTAGIIVCCFCALLNSEPSRNQAASHTRAKYHCRHDEKNML